MLELVRSLTPPRIARREPAWTDLDEAHEAIWQAVAHLFPANAMVDQADYGCLLVSWPLRGARRPATRFATPVVIRIEPGLLLALWNSDGETRRDIALAQVPIVEEALESHDPFSRIARCGVIVLGE